jgi:hypothetical protein
MSKKNLPVSNIFIFFRFFAFPLKAGSISSINLKHLGLWSWSWSWSVSWYVSLVCVFGRLFLAFLSPCVVLACLGLSRALFCLVSCLVSSGLALPSMSCLALSCLGHGLGLGPGLGLGIGLGLGLCFGLGLGLGLGIGLILFLLLFYFVVVFFFLRCFVLRLSCSVVVLFCGCLVLWLSCLVFSDLSFQDEDNRNKYK